MSGFRTRWSNNRRRKPGCHLHYSALVVRRTSALSIALTFALGLAALTSLLSVSVTDPCFVRAVYARRPYDTQCDVL